jgi:8-oxo-dGTP pyrophosphatase MutT (NUDIX family)
MIKTVLVRLPLGLQRLAYRTAYRLLRLWWLVRRSSGRGAGIALWHGGRLLLVRTSYRSTLDLPGGGVEHGEEVMAAALRELREETGIDLPATALGAPVTLRFRHEHRPIVSTVYAARIDQPMQPVIDRAEIVWAGYLSLDEMAAKELAPGLTVYLQHVGKTIT